MKQITIRFLQPNSIMGYIVAWRLVERYGHVVVIMDDAVYSAIPPKVIKHTLDHPDVAIPPRVGVDVTVSVSDEDFEKMRLWCESMIGSWYDILSILGWILDVSRVSNRRTYYCFEFCRELFVQAGLLEPTDDLITGEHLMLDLFKLNHSHDAC